jgi:hypothetical protein
MNIKLIFSIIALIIGVISFIPYFKDIFSRKTKPHAYTWLIWTITQGTAVYAIWFGGGKWGALSLGILLLFVFSVFLFSLKYGTKNITRSDTIILILAVIAIFIWWQLKQPLISVLMVSAIDFFGYIPSFRKSYIAPWSETISSWLLFSLSNLFAIFALTEYNLLTLFYLCTISTANIILALICFIRRKNVKK